MPRQLDPKVNASQPLTGKNYKLQWNQGPCLPADAGPGGWIWNQVVGLLFHLPACVLACQFAYSLASMLAALA